MSYCNTNLEKRRARNYEIISVPNPTLAGANEEVKWNEEVHTLNSFPLLS